MRALKLSSGSVVATRTLLVWSDTASAYLNSIRHYTAQLAQGSRVSDTQNDSSEQPLLDNACLVLRGMMLLVVNARTRLHTVLYTLLYTVLWVFSCQGTQGTAV
jgi:hypothetical protein